MQVGMTLRLGLTALKLAISAAISMMSSAPAVIPARIVPMSIGAPSMPGTADRAIAIRGTIGRAITDTGRVAFSVIDRAGREGGSEMGPVNVFSFMFGA
jgi:hypothetical protein